MARQKSDYPQAADAVETLGAMTVICSDKTGTLTMNEMTVKAVITLPTASIGWKGIAYEPVGKIHAIDDPTPVTIAPPARLFERYLRTIDLSVTTASLSKRRAGRENHRRPDRGGAEGAGGEGHSAAADQRTAQ